MNGNKGSYKTSENNTKKYCLSLRYEYLMLKYSEIEEKMLFKHFLDQIPMGI